MAFHDATSRDARDELGEAPEGEGADEAPDHFELEHEGQVYQLPRAIEGLIGRPHELDRREQALHAHARRVQDRHAAAEAAHANLADRVQLSMLDHQLELYESADWESLAAEDPQHAEALWARYQETRSFRDEYADAVAHHEDQNRLAAERAHAAQLEAAGRELSQQIEGWSPQVAHKLVEYAQAFGVTLDELREVADPRLWRILHRAYAGDAAAQRETAARNAAQSQAVRPAARVSGGAPSPSGVRDELATREWMRRRNDQVARG